MDHNDLPKFETFIQKLEISLKKQLIFGEQKPVKIEMC